MEKVKRLVVLATVLLLTIPMLPISNASPSIEDTTPGYWETSEYMIGSIAVGIIFVESNGTIDPNTEDWTEAEEEQITNKINDALNWWASRNPGANVSFVTEIHYKVPTNYEPINRTLGEMVLWVSETLNYLGFEGEDWSIQRRNYVNDLRYRRSTEWAFIMLIVDASNDSDGLYADKKAGTAALGGPDLEVPVKTTDNLEWTIAHEMGHIFWATDEYNGRTEYSGYLNVPDVEGSGGLMWDPRAQYHFLSGEPHGLNGTWGQIGWRDSDGDGIQDIVDTFPRVYLNSPEISQGRVNYNGVTAVTPFSNNNPYTWNPKGKRDVTINKIKSIEFRVNSGNWTLATPTDGSFGDAIENFNLVTEELEPGNHTIEIKATNQWGNSGSTNTTVTIQEFLETDLNKDGIVNILDITIVAVAWTPEGTTPDHPKWNPIADLDDNGKINIIDISKVARDYKKTT